MTFALNACALFLLTHLLRDTLQASAPARIVTVASAQHAGKHVPFDDMTDEKGYKPLQVYGESKLIVTSCPGLATHVLGSACCSV
jgi:hypothetical protein